MKNSTKGILAAIPLVVGLAGTATAALGDSADAGASNTSPASIDSLLNQYSGLTPGDHDMAAASQETPQSQQLSSYTHAASSMNSGYTNQGVDRSSPGQSAHSGDFIASQPRAEQDSTVAAPGVAAFTAAHAAQDSLVGAVASSAAPTSSSTSNSEQITPTGAVVQITPPETGTVTTPILPAAALLGSGLTALAALRRRDQDLSEV